jgi:hypothetical protein
MKSFEKRARTVLALLVSAAVGLILGISFYMLRQSFGWKYYLDSESPDCRILSAVQIGTICGAAIFFFTLRKIKPVSPTSSQELYSQKLFV